MTAVFAEVSPILPAVASVTNDTIIEMATEARYQGPCPLCDEPIEVGMKIEHLEGEWVHAHHKPPSSEPAKERSSESVEKGRPPLSFSGVIEARHEGPCPLCGAPIEKGDEITKVRGEWVHAHHSPEESEPIETLDHLVFAINKEFGGAYNPLSKGLVYIGADIRVRQLGPDSWRLHARLELVFIDDTEVSDAEFRARRRDLWSAGRELMEELANDSFNGRRYPDYVRWPESSPYG